MNTKEALDLLKSIPSKNFITNEFSDGEGKCCAVGHLVRLTSENPDDYSRDNCGDLYGYESAEKEHGKVVGEFREFTKKFIAEKHGEVDDISGVNNNPFTNGYTQNNPKSRVINLLKDMVKAGY